LDALSIELDGVLRELETLLDERGQLADTATLLTKNVLGVGGTDDNSEEQKKGEGRKMAHSNQYLL
jgi:hypothetical protein